MDYCLAIKIIFSQQFWRMALLWTFSLLYSYFRLIFIPHSDSQSQYPRCRPDFEQIKRPVCIITGATSGLGAAAARALAAESYHVILVGRSSMQLHQTIEDIKQEHKDALLDAFQVDMASIHSIRKFERSIKQCLLDVDLQPSIQLLINNAGIFATSCRVTDDGYDEMMETNYIGAFVLTNLLLPLLQNSLVPSRIVNVTSFTHRSVSDAQVDAKSLICLPAPGHYPFAYVYECSKLCLLLFTYELHRQLRAANSSSNVSVNAADPGAVETRIMRELPQCLSWLAFTVLRCLCLLQSPEDGVGSILDAALAPPEVSGKYFFSGKGRTMQSSSLSYNAKLANSLWYTSNALFQEYLQMKG